MCALQKAVIEEHTAAGKRESQVRILRGEGGTDAFSCDETEKLKHVIRP